MKLSKLTFDSSNYTDRRISANPELLITFLQSKMYSAGRVYYALKFLDFQNAGILTTNYIKKAVCSDKNSSLYLMSYGNLLKILHKYNGDFWIFENERIVLKSPGKVANYFELDKFAFDSVWLYPDQLFNGTSVFNATCYAAYVTTLGDMPTSRETIFNETGLHKTAQIRYEKLAGIEQSAAAIVDIKILSMEGKKTTRVFDEKEEYFFREGCRIGNIRSYSRMLKASGGRTRRNINKDIESVFRGKRNKHLDSDELGERTIKNESDKLILWGKAFIKSAVQFKEVVQKDLSIKRYGVLKNMDCYLFW